MDNLATLETTTNTIGVTTTLPYIVTSGGSTIASIPFAQTFDASSVPPGGGGGDSLSSSPRPDRLLRFFAASPNHFNQVAQALSERKAKAGSSATISGGMAVVPIVGPMLKGDGTGLWGATDTVFLRYEFARIAADPSISHVVLLIDSPGGEVAGTADLAFDIAKLNQTKPVYTLIEDLGASAAYWAASQASFIAATPTSEIGSLGVYSVLVDMSEMAKQMGVRVHVVSTGSRKGAFTPGLPISEADLAYAQERVDTINDFFLADVAKGRGMKASTVRDLADGSVMIASKALDKGLIDKVLSRDEFLATVQRKQRIASMRSGRS